MVTVKVFSDDNLIYDNHAPDELPILNLSVDTELNSGGSATIELPQTNPFYDSVLSFKSIIRIYKNDNLIFRGRVLYRENDFRKNRTFTCEGEMCFLNDTVHRPYLYQSSPESIFRAIIENHNTQAEADKQFTVGTVTVTDANDYLRIESSYAETSMELIDKLLNYCGGYITFTYDTEGNRRINWLESLPYTNKQDISFGENLTDLNISEDNTELATRIIPYGAVLEDNESRVTIESVNNGIDFIQDDEAISIRGIITKAVYWDDVSIPANLLKKAQKYLAESKNIITSIELTAVDLSYTDSSYDEFQIGDTVHVTSPPHKIDDDFIIVSKGENLLNASANKLYLSKNISSLTSLDFAVDAKNNTALKQTEQKIKADYTADIANTVESAKQMLTSLIQQTSDSIMSEVTEQYATNNDIEKLISTKITQLSDRVEFLFTDIQQTVDENDASAREQFATISKYIRFENGNIILGNNENELILKQQNDRISFIDGGAEVAYFSNKKLIVTDAHFLNMVQVGNFALIPRENNNLSFVKVS